MFGDSDRLKRRVSMDCLHYCDGTLDLKHFNLKITLIKCSISPLKAHKPALFSKYFLQVPHRREWCDEISGEDCTTRLIRYRKL